MAYLEVSSDEHEEYIFHLDTSTILVGRDPACGMTLPDQRISRKHFRIYIDQNRWRIEDLGSTNGILINNERVSSAKLSPDDEIRAGPFQMIFRDSAPEKEPSLVLRGEELTLAMAGRKATSAPTERESGRRYNLLLDIAAALDSFGSTVALLDGFKRVLSELFSPAVALIHFERETAAYTTEGNKPPPEALRFAEASAARVTHSKEALVFDEVTQSSQALGTKGRRVTVLCAPVFTLDRQSCGSVYLDRRLSDATPPFADEDLRLLIAVTRLLSAALLSSVKFSRLSAENRLLTEKNRNRGDATRRKRSNPGSDSFHRRKSRSSKRIGASHR